MDDSRIAEYGVNNLTVGGVFFGTSAIVFVPGDDFAIVSVTCRSIPITLLAEQRGFSISTTKVAFSLMKIAKMNCLSLWFY